MRMRMGQVDPDLVAQLMTMTWKWSYQLDDYLEEILQAKKPLNSALTVVERMA
jgi:hypothetical protein